MLRHIRVGGRGLLAREGAERGGRNAVASAEGLGEGLGALQPGGSGRRPERLDASRLEPVDEAERERKLGPDDDEADAALPGERDDPVEVVDAEVDALRHLSDARIAGSTVDL